MDESSQTNSLGHEIKDATMDVNDQDNDRRIISDHGKAADGLPPAPSHQLLNLSEPSSITPTQNIITSVSPVSLLPLTTAVSTVLSPVSSLVGVTCAPPVPAAPPPTAYMIRPPPVPLTAANSLDPSLFEHQQARLAQQREAMKPSGSDRNDDNDDDDIVLEMTNTTTYNINTLLRENILHSEYFKSLYGFSTFEEIINEIQNYVDHAEPYLSGHSRAPSTLFCCLYKLFTMKLKEHEVQTMLDSIDSPYVRCAGLLFLRYVHPPDNLLDWFKHYLLDDEEFTSGVDKTRKTTIGEFAEKLLAEDRYFNTVLPRIPVKVKAQDGPQLLTLPSHRKRKERNKTRIDEFQHGTPVVACVSGEWLEGVVVSLEELTKGQLCCDIRFKDGYEELVDMGLVILLDAKVRQEKRREERDIRRAARGLPALDYSRRRSIEEKKKCKRGISSTRDVPRPDNDNWEYSRYAERRKSHDRRPSSSCSLEESRKRHRRNGDRVSREGKDREYERKRDDRYNDRNGRRGRGSYRDRDFLEREKGRDRGKERDMRRSLSLGYDRPKTEQELIDEFRRREREKALATGKDYARRPTSYKSALSIKFDGSTRKRGRSPSPVVQRVNLSTPSLSNEEKKDPEDTRRVPSAAYQQKMAALVERYSKPIS